MKTKSIVAFDKSREYTREGYLKATAKISRTGIQIYTEKELSISDSDSNVRIYRSSKEVFNKKSLESFYAKPITLFHPSSLVDSKTAKEVSVGLIMSAKKDGKYVTADIIITDENAIKIIEDGTVELSCGYTFDLVIEKGTTQKEEMYDGRQENITGNHVAIVKSGRCGESCKINDKMIKGENKMTEKEEIKKLEDELNKTKIELLKSKEAQDTALSKSKKDQENFNKKVEEQVEFIEKLKAIDSSIEYQDRSNIDIIDEVISKYIDYVGSDKSEEYKKSAFDSLAHQKINNETNVGNDDKIKWSSDIKSSNIISDALNQSSKKSGRIQADQIKKDQRKEFMDNQRAGGG